MLKIKRALFSISNKDLSVEFAGFLNSHNVEIFASSGTAHFLQSNKIDAKDISSITGFSNLLNGRVKTLDQKIFASILARKEKPDDLEEISSLGLHPFDLVVCNLYPFGAIAEKPFCSHSDIIENIDIGGVSLIRAAAKNYINCGILTSPEQYKAFQHEFLKYGGLLQPCLLELAVEAFRMISIYDGLILREMTYWSVSNDGGFERDQQKFPKYDTIHLSRVKKLSYGENPHQEAALYTSISKRTMERYSIEQLNGKELSYNNILDSSSCLDILSEFQGQNACIIVKHTNPCGAGISESPAKAFKRAFATDNKSPFGGIVGFNSIVDEDTANEISRIFFEVILARDFTKPALKKLTKKKNLRLLRYKDNNISKGEGYDLKTTPLGCLFQDTDWLGAGFPLKVVTKRQPDKNERSALLLAWKIAKHTKSNAVVIADVFGTIAIGAGQMNRVGSLFTALSSSILHTEGSVMASDGFFPFSDSIDLAIKAGITAIIQPGGSIRDEDVISKANEGNIAMVFTNFRNFKH